jgi:hypothetical protein
MYLLYPLCFIPQEKEKNEISIKFHSSVKKIYIRNLIAFLFLWAKKLRSVKRTLWFFFLFLLTVARAYRQRRRYVRLEYLRRSPLSM